MKEISIVINDWKLEAYKKALKDYTFTHEPIVGIPDVKNVILINVKCPPSKVNTLKLHVKMLENRLRNIKGVH